MTFASSPNRAVDVLFSGSLPKPLSSPITWIDTSSDQRHMDERAERNRHSFWNPAEVEAVLKILERIAERDDLVRVLTAGSSETPIGVICMYSAQKAKIEQAFSQRPWDPRFRRLVRVDTVDSYLGKENIVVIASLVRCNNQGDAGHVGSPNRCNVAFSRAKERLFIVGALRMWTRMTDRQPVRRVIDYVKRNSAGAITLETGEL